MSYCVSLLGKEKPGVSTKADLAYQPALTDSQKSQILLFQKINHKW